MPSNPWIDGCRRCAALRMLALLIATSALMTATVSAQPVQVNVDPVLNVQQIDSVQRLEAIPGQRDFSGRILVRPKAGVAESIATELVEPHLVDYKPRIDTFVVEVPAGMDDETYAKGLDATGLYEIVEPDWKVYLAETTPDDPQLGTQWHHAIIQSTLAWDVTTGDPNLIIAIIDTGVDSDHEDLAASLIPGAHINADVGTFYETFPGEYTNDTHGHGTHVAGIAAAIGNNATGVSGIGWGFTILPIRVTSDAEPEDAYLTDIFDAVNYATDRGAKVINVSFSGGTSFEAALAGTAAWTDNALLCWAAGNSGAELTGIDSSAYMLVAATTAADKRWTGSNYGQAIDIGAPGAGVYSTWNSGGYNFLTGTSMATPVMSGCAALVFSANPLLTPDEVQDVLFSTANDIGETEANLGHGRVNLFNAVTAALTYSTDHTLTVEASHALAELITVSPLDVNSLGDGITTFQRTYPRLADVTLTAPAVSADGRHFDRWELKGVEQTVELSYVAPMTGSHTATAVYSNQLSIESDPPGAPIVLSPSDLDGQAFGLMPLVASYYEGSGNVQLSAIDRHEDMDFREWRIDGEFLSSDPITLVSTDSDATIMAIYGNGVLGDLNCSGAVDAFDIDPFIEALLSPATYADNHPDCDVMLADINDDDAVNAFDIEPFIDLLLG